MWIRSQKKDVLVFCNHIEVDKNTVYGNEYFLGRYATEYRALEVLDLVQSKIIQGIKFDELHNSVRKTRDFVFQMPEK